MGNEPIDIKSIFSEALQKKDAQVQAAYLDKACGNDIQLRAKVEALLRAHQQAGDFLEAPAFGADVTLDNALKIEGPGTRIGRYELLELIGEGGMGLVYLAEQKEPVKRRVALKIIKPGMDSKQVIARFEAERQALALLDHPNIAHIFDADTTETGRPYFVMEYVKGMSITRYCDERKLNIEQRLRLFEQVCEAVHHAHQKGIIHRDIKPSNVLVSVHGDRAVPKIIDFGIAKAITQPLTDKTFVTFQGQLLGTPEYMSPEQVDLATQDIDTRSDIYSLGVVLYELLAGVLPFERESFERAGFAEIQQMVREQEPASPSIRLTHLGEKAKTIAASRGTQVIALARRLHRELEWIPLKAMRKDRCRRYRSASEMADDVRNYLDGLPLIAGPETAVYRVRKFVYKHAGSVATVALVAVAILLGLVVSTAMYFRAEDARKNEAVARGKAEQAEQATKQKAEELRRTLYVNSIQLADAKYREGNIRRVRELLESCPNDLRGWEWNRLNYISDQSLMTLRGHKGWVDCAAISPDGKRIASGGQTDHTIRIWDMVTGKELVTIPDAHEDLVRCVSFNTDGKRLVSGSRDKTIKVWDVETGAEVKTLRSDGYIECASISPDGKRIFSSGGEGKTIRVWDAETGETVKALAGHTNAIWSLAVSPDGKQIVSGSWDGTIKVWDVESGTEAMTLRGHEGQLHHVAFSPDGRRVVSGGQEDHTIKIWDIVTGKELITIPEAHDGLGLIYSVAFSPDNRHICSGSWDETIKVWDAATGENVLTLLGHEGWVLSVAFSPDGKHIVSSGSGDGTIKVWDVTVDHEITKLAGHHSSVSSIAFSPDGRRLVSGSQDGMVKLWDTRSLTELMTLRSSQEKAIIYSVAFSPDGRYVASGGSAQTFKIWDAANGSEMTTFHGHEGSIETVAFSPDGKHVASGSGDKTLKVWDVSSGKELMTLKGHESGLICVAFSPDGKFIAAGSRDPNIRVWEWQTGSECLILRGHSRGIILSVAFSPDGKRIVSACQEDHTVKVWDALTGAELTTLKHADVVISAVFSIDGKRVISGCRDKTARVWDATTGAELLTLRAESGVTTVAFDPDGKTIAAGTFDGRVVLWESAAPPGGRERQNGETARKVVDELHQKHGYYYEVIDKLQADKTLDEPVRKLALQIANSRKTEDAEKLMNEIGEEVMQMVGSPGGDPNVYRAALEKVEKARLMDPNNPGILVVLGMAQQAAGQYEDAIKTLTRAHRLDPNAPAILGPLSDAQYHAGKYEDAMKTLAKELEIERRVLGEEDGLTVHTLNQLAWVQATCPAAEVRNGAEAVKNATRACELTQWKEAQYVDTLAAAYSETGDFDSAVKWQKKAISLLTKEDPAEWPGEFDERLKLYESGKPYRESP
jgi:WD40 repeat protein/tetratricopeptide (TPR) repeat protein/tRNA A-37 threonylcarbamoyl transferase component Bud32